MALADERKLYSVGLDSDESQTVSKPSGATDGFYYILTPVRHGPAREGAWCLRNRSEGTGGISEKRCAGGQYDLPHKPIGSGYTAVRILPKGKSLIAAEG